MEAIAVVSSIVTLTQLLGGAVKGVNAIARVLNSPSAIAKLSAHASFLEAKLQSLAMLETWTAQYCGLMSENACDTLRAAVHTAQDRLLESSKFCQSFCSTKRKRVKNLLWPLRDAYVWEELSSHLQQVETALDFVLQVIQLEIGTLQLVESRKITNDVLSRTNTIDESVGGRRDSLFDEPSHKQRSSNDESCRVAQEDEKIHFSGASSLGFPWVVEQCLQVLRLSARKGFAESCNLSLQIPITTITRKYALTVEVNFTSYSQRWRHVDFGLGWRNIIPHDASIIKWCLDGNLDEVKKIFLRREVGPDDVTPDFRPLLWYAIDGGSIEVVQFLLSVGADPTALSGGMNASLLHIAFYHRRSDIVRLLMSKGADIEQLNVEGIVAPFHLFQPAHRQSSSLPTEFRDLLSGHCLGLFDTQSCQGWTIFHRAAAYGTAEDVDFCIYNGASLNLVTSDHLWTPLFVAVAFDNIETYKELARHYGPGHIAYTDARGWTLLHVAAEVGNPQLIQLLMKEGSDVNAFSSPGSPLVAAEIRDLFLTPLDVAKYYGEEKLQNFIHGLNLAGILIHSDGIFWPCEDFI